MVGVSIAENAKVVSIAGHGLSIESRFGIVPGIFIAPPFTPPDINDVSKNVSEFHEYAAILAMKDLASFSIEVHEETGGKALGIKSSNVLWLFHLLSLACRGPCFSLFSVSRGDQNAFSVANRNIFINAIPSLVPATIENLEWAQKNFSSFDSLIKNKKFSSAMLCFGYAHYLFDMTTRIMLVWLGIEGLFSVDSELSRRLALYAALLSVGTAEEKLSYFKQVKSAYNVRSKVVHGNSGNSAAMIDDYKFAMSILAGALARCVELGRVPTPSEFDALAVSQSVL